MARWAQSDFLRQSVRTPVLLRSGACTKRCGKMVLAMTLIPGAVAKRAEKLGLHVGGETGVGIHADSGTAGVVGAGEGDAVTVDRERGVAAGEGFA